MHDVEFFHDVDEAFIKRKFIEGEICCFALEPNHSRQSTSATNMFTHEQRRGQGLTVTFARTLCWCPVNHPSTARVCSDNPGRLARAADSQLCRTKPGNRVSPRVCRPARRQSSRWLCGHPSTVACGSNHNRPFKQPSSLTAGINEVLDFIARGRSRNHGRRPSFLLPSRRVGATSDLPVRNSQFMNPGTTGCSATTSASSASPRGSPCR